MKIAANLFFCLMILLTKVPTGDAEDWTRFRGPNGSGISTGKSAPTEWDANRNIKWSLELPGPGSSSPIVLGDRVYVTCYTGYGIDPENPGDVSQLQRHLIGVNRVDGKEVWRATVDSAHDEDLFQGFITDHGYASSTPVTDGKHLFVQFGKTGVFAFDTSGKQVWSTNVGTKTDPAKWGDGASCVLYKDLVLVNAGNTDHAIIALNKSDGKEVWRIKDAKFTDSWSTPIIVRVEDHDEMIIDMPGRILAYDPATGKEIWWAKSPIEKTVCGSCVYDDGVVYAMGGRDGRAIAVKVGGKGDVSETHTLWEQPLRSGIGTPIAVNGNLYWSATGIAFCVDCKTGEYRYKERLKAESADGAAQRRPAGDYASPVSIGDRILLTARNGTVHVIEASDEYKKVGENSFEGESRFNATPAVSDGQIFIRSDNQLYCISE